MARLRLDPTSSSGISPESEDKTTIINRQSHGYVAKDITGLLTAGTNVTITGNGTSSSPYNIASSGTGGGSGDMTKAVYDPAPINEQLVGLTATQTLTNKTLTAPKISTILDTNGNAIVDLLVTASAVNYLQIKNNGAGFTPGIIAVGTDTNINIDVTPKGTGRLRQSGAIVPTISSADALTNKDLSSGTNTFPTLNQNTTGSAAKLTTARNIAGVAFDGSAAISLTSGSSLLKGDGSGGFSNATAGTDYQAPLSLTTTGSSGAATLVSNVLNIPQYSAGGGSGTVTSVDVSGGTTGLTTTGGPVTSSGAITLAGTLAVSNGGTGSASRNFVDLTSTETVAGVKTFSSAPTLSAGATMNATSIVTDTTTGLKIGTATTQKIGFFNVTPVVQQPSAGDIGGAMAALGLRGNASTYTISTSGTISGSGVATYSAAFRLTSSARTANVTLTLATAPAFQLCDATTASFVITLGTAVGASGQILTFKKTDATANTVTIDANGSETIDGALTYVLTAQWKYVTIYSNNANWLIMGSN